MKKIGLLILFYIIAIEAVFSQEKTAVDYRAETTKLIKLGDSSVVKLIGDVYLYQNGTVISCDSAYRYSEKRFEALGNVIINQNSLYIYGNKVLYNGESEQAEVFSELIKIVDSTAVMYTRQLTFNTRTKIGQFSGGATLRQNESVVEAMEGYYNTETKIFELKDRVAMENEEYILKTNDLIYDQNKENIFFNTLTNIWNKKGEYLQADKGRYEKLPKIYNFDKNSYILTKEQECWSDSLIYYSMINEVEMKRNIQIVDTTQNMVSFGDYGFFWSDSKNILLTKEPSMFTYMANSPDTTFLRADTITVKPIIERDKIEEFLKQQEELNKLGDSTSVNKDLDFNIKDKLVDSISSTRSEQSRYDAQLAKGVQQEADKNNALLIAELREKGEHIKADSVQNLILKQVEESNKPTKTTIDAKSEIKPQDGLQIANDSTAINTNDSTTNTKEAIKEDVEKTLKYTPAFTQEQLDSMSDKDRSRAYRIMKKDKRRYDRKLRLIKKGRYVPPTIEMDTVKQDSMQVDSVQTEKPEGESDILEIKNQADTSDYIVRAYGSARIYKFDMQSVADTMIVETVDSTMTSISNPYAWNGLNQIQAKRIRTYTKGGNLDRTRMFSSPILSQEVQKEKYNMMGGDYMDALYRNNEIYRLIVNKDSETRFYREERVPDSERMEIVAFISAASVNMIIDMANSMVTRIKWIGQTETYTYPLDRVPEDKLILEGFEWVPELRPTKKDVFTRTVRASVRREREAIKKPDFNITKQIMDQRATLLKHGWIDRDDKLKINVNELFQQSLKRHN